ncbi:hypothetical protein JQ596_19940 [Bradyrhizobium manausense]|uniref:hypothetical protein n=1 Tax=Bradyrhizobium TaxID=374 RepID=UPI001BA8BFFE|nr:MULTISPECIES: hypothetical protein [Bradyrhizobium]MBR0827806.1 hypothetical protein [Bradyrhizobium manausense]UVO26276.1 hypothetical protein KUF59_27400 [Bradyrhizobium arachidis]
MKIRTLCGTLILAGLMAAIVPPTMSLAQSNAPVTSAPKDTGMSAPKDQTKSEAKTKSATPNTNMTPTKHRYWRHRGGKHPHYGSRRVRTQVQAPQ